MKSYQSHLVEYLHNSKKPITINTSRNSSINISHLKSNSIINPATTRNNKLSINVPIKLPNGYITTSHQITYAPVPKNNNKCLTKQNVTLKLSKKDSHKNSVLLSSTLTRNTIELTSNFNATMGIKRAFPQISPRTQAITKKLNPKQVDQQLREAIKKQFATIGITSQANDAKFNTQQHKPTITLLKKNTTRYQNPQSPSVSSTNLNKAATKVNNLVAPVSNKIKSLSFNSCNDKIPEELLKVPKVMPKNTALDPRESVSPRNSNAHDYMGSTEDLKIPFVQKPNNDMTPSNAMDPKEAINKYSDDLAVYECEEIHQFNEIYYVGKLESKLQKLDQSSMNYGWDDRKGFYHLKVQDHLKYRYEVLSIIGNGSFGVVYKCLDWKTKEECAVKILRNKDKFHKQGRIEVDILKALNNSSKKESQFVVDMKDSFVFRNHICIVFEMLSIDLYQLIKSSKFSGFTLPLIKAFAKQLIVVINYMKRLNIIHCDLKPENILLKNKNKSAIKVIDFGTGCFAHSTYYTYIQSRYYRAPEIILGIPYTCAIDMWSFGCILVELFNGYPMFAGENEFELLAMIMEYKGIPPIKMILKGSRSRAFFDLDFQPLRIVNSKGIQRTPNSKSIESFLNSDDGDFIDFIKRCLEWNPEKRLTPQEASQHRWLRD